MGIRTLSQLRVDQAALLEEYRGRNVEAVGPSSVEEIEAVTTFAKVSSVVTSDPTYGAHLVVDLQEFSGTPRVPAAASKPSLRAYPTPNRVVTDYAVNEYVVLQTARGALVAVKLG